MRWLVTGGLGFIGSHFIRLVLRERPNVEIVNLDAMTYAGNPENLRDVEGNARYRFVRGDICDASAVSAALAGGADAILNFAAETHVDRSILTPREFLRTDALGTLVLLEAARERAVPRLLQVSTDEVYGDVARGESLETDPVAPRSPYAASKAAADLMTLAYHSTYGGARAHHARQQHIWPQSISRKDRAALRHEFDRRSPRARLRRRPANSRLAARRRPRARDPSRTRKRHAGQGLQRCRRSAADESRPDPHADAPLRTIHGDARQSRHGSPGARSPLRHKREKLYDLGWRPQIAFADGIAQTVAWYRANESWWRP